MEILLVLILGILVGWVSTRVRLPSAAMQVLLGMLIGPLLLGWVTPGDTLLILGELGVVLLLGTTGMHLGLGRLREGGWAGLWVALLGIFFSFSGGYGFATWWGSPGPEAVYIGAALTATSIGISVEVLRQFGLLENKIGKVVLAAAVVDDILALYLLAVVHGLLSDGFGPLRLVWFGFSAFVLLFLILAVCQILGRRVGVLKTPIGSIGFLVAAVFLMVGFGVLTEWAGYSIVIGGFFAGLGLGEGLGEVESQKLVRWLNPLTKVFVPFYFVFIGLQAELGVLEDTKTWELLFGLLVVAFAGKILSGVLVSVKGEVLSGRLLVGMSMVPRGEVGLIIATLGFEQNHVSHHPFVVLIIVTVVSSIIAPFFVIPLAKHRGSGMG